KMYCHKYKKTIKKISDSTLKKLKSYHWPGNVRELQHAIERAVILSESPVLTPDDFLFPPVSDRTGDREDGSQNYNLDEMEKRTISRAIEKHDGNISQAARELGLTRTSLYRRMKKYKI
ncbi:MAG: helix-turn-helix domain-containing protein, partial [Candidatus Aminicenantes bacterium]|nr:helix-turn-helix domain-containing protein [Candidatus Aminicenantes bacterium]